MSRPGIPVLQGREDVNDPTSLVGQWRRLKGARNRHYVTSETATDWVLACKYGWEYGRIGKTTVWGLMPDDEPDKPKCSACCKTVGEAPPPMANPPVRGHGLLEEGAPFDEHGTRIRPRGTWTDRGGAGRAKCQCGALSDVLPSAAARRRWHRDTHKPEVRSANQTTT